MASSAHAVATSPETLITIKVVFDGSNRKFKLPLHELNAHIFSERIRSILQIPENERLLLERFSDSGNAYITLDQANPSAYKQLFRAAKAKLKLRIRASIIADSPTSPVEEVKKREQSLPEPTLRELKGLDAPKDLGCAHARDQFFHHLANISREREMGRRMKEAPPQIASSSWQIFCNNCDKPMTDAHFHCSVCDGGDYDLCEGCVESGKTCPGEGHWLIKRFIKNGRVVNSTTEKIMPKPLLAKEKEHDIPGAFTSEVKTTETFPEESSRTCNSCVRVLPENMLVTCKDCPDYDLCVKCFKTKHGHHPGHAFEPTVSNASIAPDVASLCAPGRSMRHYAICDGCDETILGVRYKCLNCPDWDFCNKCKKTSGTTHRGHRFVPVYSTLEVPESTRTLHYGIFCDGPLCSGKPGQSYIKGIRYKCAICHDTDFCANCEAHPSNKHNESHPLIKFKTAVRGASITTVESKPGQGNTAMGDNLSASPSVRLPAFNRTRPHIMSQHLSTTTLPPYTPAVESVSNVAVGTQCSVQPGIEHKESAVVASAARAETAAVPLTDLDAHFMKDSITDGTKIAPGTPFIQVWTLKNPGPHAWPVGCTVSHVGGDNMLYLGRRTPVTVSDLALASRSNATLRVVESGEEHRFVASMQAPSREGKFISYWRLKAPDGTPFGHKLWCDVEVVESARVVSEAGALTDFQMQHMLLEQQRQKERLAKIAQAEHAQLQLEMSQSSANLAPGKPCDEEVAKAPGAVEPEILNEPTTSENLESSAMVFPTLEKESPTSSTYQDATSAVPVSAPAPPPTAGISSEKETETMTVSTGEENFEDLESVEYEDSDDDDGFMTDEEYDILDASDEEVLNRGKTGL